MNVLVTGGAGYIGSHTCVELIEAGHTPIVIDNLSNSNPESLHRVAEITGKTVEFIEGDVRDEALLEKIFAEHEISCAIHFAGLKAVGESVAKPLEYYRNNLDATMTLCKVMAKHNVKRIIFSSSATVYSGDNEMPLRETSKTGNCTNPYGWTKYMGEQILRDIVKADPEWSVVNLRYFNPVGAHESGKIGEHPNGIPNNLMPYISQTAIGKRDHLNVFGNDYPTPDGTGVRDYIHVVDLAKGHVAAIQYLMTHTGEGVFNLGTGHGYSVLDMVHAFEEANGVKVPYEITARRPGDLATCYADPAKSLEVLGWKAEKNLVDMCRDTWNWQKQNPTGYEQSGEIKMLHLNIIKVKTPEEMGRAAADEFEAVICRKPACVMGLATGSTPLPLYRELVAREQAGKLDFSRVRSANLDEYKGLAPDHPQSYRRFMQENLFDHISIKPENTIVPDGLAADIPAMCEAYERQIEDWGGVDIQLLGIGHDGHIGFNEPCDHFPVMTHEVKLTEMTREANKRFFSSIDEVPTAAVTMGVGTVMAARKIVMVITGADKADILYKVFFGPVTPEVPGSILQFHHDVTLICDEAAAARMPQ